jgi:hypothetical protein
VSSPNVLAVAPVGSSRASESRGARAIREWAVPCGFLILAAAQASLALTHEPWRDEVQALLIAAHASTLGDLFRILHYEGHPALWYLALRVVTSLGGGIAAMRTLQMAVGLGVMATIWRRAPFAPAVKLLIAANYFCFVEYGVIARSYGLGCLLFFLFLSLRGGWLGWLLLALIANVEFHFTLLSIACVGMILWIDKRWSWGGFALWVCGCVTATATAWPIPGAGPQVKHSLAEMLVFPVESSSALVIPVDPFKFFQWNSFPDAVLCFAAGLLVPILLWFSVGRDRRAGFLLLGLFGAVCLSSALVYPAWVRHVGVVFLLAVGLEWRAAEAGDSKMSRTSLAWFATTSLFGVAAAIAMFITPFSQGGRVADWIRAHGLADAAWAAQPPWFGVDLASRLDRPIYDAEEHCWAWYEFWAPGAYLDGLHMKIGPSLAEAASAAGGKLYVMAATPFDPPPGATVEKIAHFPKSPSADALTLYEIRAAPMLPIPHRACD